MNKFIHIEKSRYLLSVIGLITLLLFSPCKVRNFIQAELGIPQTKVLNKSQTTISQSHCETFDTSHESSSVAKVQALNPAFKPNAKFQYLHSEIQVELKSTSKKTIVENTSTVPLYILHQNLKVYS